VRLPGRVSRVASAETEVCAPLADCDALAAPQREVVTAGANPDAGKRRNALLRRLPCADPEVPGRDLDALGPDLLLERLPPARLSQT
jgi:hypothetical protein